MQISTESLNDGLLCVVADLHRLEGCDSHFFLGKPVSSLISQYDESREKYNAYSNQKDAACIHG